MAAVVVAAIVVVALVLARGGDGEPRGVPSTPTVTSPPITGDPVPDDASFTIGDRALSYRIVYRVDDLGDAAVVPGTDEVVVRRPAESRLRTFRGAPPGGGLLSVQIAALDRLRLGQVDQPLIIARVPGVGVSDLRIAPVLAAGVEAGLLERRGQRMVAGRRCEVVRSGTVLGAGPLVPITAGEHAESCFDAEGLLLEETLFLQGRPTLHRIAVEVRTSLTITDDTFEVGPIVVPVDKGGGSSTAVDPTVGAVGPFWVLPAAAVPAGFEHKGRLSIVPPQPDKFAEPQNPSIIAGTADVYVRGADLIVLWQGGTIGQVDAFAPSPHASPIEVAGLGRGEQLLSALGTELRFSRPSGTFVHVIGTLAPAALREVAGALIETDGAGLVPI